MTAFLDWLAQRKKAIAGALYPGAALLAADLAHEQGFPTQNEWKAIVLACLVTGLGVHFAPENTPAPPKGD